MTTRSRVIMVLLGVCGMALILFATARGIGLSPDSSAYIGAARGLLQGLGLSTPLTDGQINPLVHYAPLLPTLLAAMGLLGIDPLAASRWLNSTLFAGNILLAGHIIQRETGSAVSAVSGSILLMIALPILKVHSMAWSEPTFTLLSLLALLWLSQYARREGGVYLLAAAGAIGLAALSRYIGFFLIGAGVVVVIMHRRPNHREMLRDCAVLVAMSSLLSGLWLARNWAVSGTLTARSMAVHPIGLAEIRLGLGTIARWFWIDAGPRRLLTAILTVGAMALVLRLARLTPIVPSQRAETNHPPAIVATTALIFIAGYGLFLVVTMSLFDAATPLDDRILSPVLAWALVGGICGAHRLVAQSSRRRWGRPLALIAGMWFAVAQLLQIGPWIFKVHRDGQGYTTTTWQQSAILAMVRSLPPATRIFSNGDDAIYLLTGRPADRIPEGVSATTAQANEKYDAELGRMRQRLSEGPGVVVYFSAIDWRPNLVSAEKLQERIRLRALYAAADGVVFRLQE